MNIRFPQFTTFQCHALIIFGAWNVGTPNTAGAVALILAGITLLFG